MPFKYRPIPSDMGGKSRWKFTTCEVEGSIMPEFVALSPNVEVLGQTVLAVVEGMGAFRNLALEILKTQVRTQRVQTRFCLET